MFGKVIKRKPELYSLKDVHPINDENTWKDYVYGSQDYAEDLKHEVKEEYHHLIDERVGQAFSEFEVGRYISVVASRDESVDGYTVVFHFVASFKYEDDIVIDYLGCE